ncbi:putative secreted protein (Por secretion system target) [Winogradskyella wandonensis]|uniref:Putative secreted protein (Por secretion system target) n=1 Tax=Winogradskyella wandonensis TaxID=1442586 RepID=A0A4R1KNH1_9FLAO|nr:alpha-amylase family glycosyl hydrolase [Winogradskyella wandonensis]TCK65189.1 putative secreted protein (Por secretion system target) [Winogradskyella wandonensis]
MKKTLLLLIGIIYTSATVKAQTFTWSPEFFEETDNNVTLTVSGFNPITEWGVSDIYLWAWHITDNGTQINNPTATGTDFSNSPETAKFTNNNDGTYSFNFGIPTDFFNNTGIATIGFLIKSQDGSNQSGDNFKDLGLGKIVFINPTQNTVILNSGDDLFIETEIEFEGNTQFGATYSISYSGTASNTPLSGTCGFPRCSNTITNITSSGTVTFTGNPPSNNNIDIEGTIEVIVSPTVVEEALPAGLVDGINYDSTDATKATLVLTAPNKDFVEVAGSFNNYQPQASDVMKRDPVTGKYWLEITGLTSGQIETYQYWVYDTTPISGSPVLVKVADPYSTLVLSPFDDPFIPASSYPNLPAYPTGQEREVTVLQTGQTPYNWVVTNFNKPKEEDLIVYELLVRDFDANRNYQDIIDRIDYFKNLGVNAIELMPVMEFEGNESWGYNTAFHMALDKFYGTPEKFKELVDVCHQNGIAVILDIAFNHAFGRNPLVRMWMDDPDGDGWGGPSTENPYFNVFPTHSFNVGSDFDHSNTLTRDYVKQVTAYWIEEYKIDGYRWDLTKGFTQNCGNGTFDGDFGCTQNYQQDRIDVLKEYIDHLWAIDPDHYSIFEHLGSDNEEKEWANYRLDEGKGVMMWGKMTGPYNELTMGQDLNKDIRRMGHKDRAGFNGPRVIGYPESHDEERLMYNNIINGKNFGGYNVTDLNTALSRMSALGAVSVMVPGPKMIWHFGELGMENSIFTCTNGTVNTEGDAAPGDCKLDTKPQPQWTNNWLSDALRSQIYSDWARLHALKTTEDVFEGDYTIFSNSTDFTPSIRVFDNSIANTELNDVFIIANFDVVSQNIDPVFTAGVTTWYDLMDETGTTTVPGSTTSITVPAGQFRIFGNQSVAALSTNDVSFNTFNIYPNPANTSFQINSNISDVEIYDLSGKLIKWYKGYFNSSDSFDISSLKTGVYILRAKNESNQISTSKLIKL